MTEQWEQPVRKSRVKMSISRPHAWSITNIYQTVSSCLSGGFLANSLAIMNDALHQLFDLNSLLMSLVASWIARWKPNEKKTFGYYRAGKIDFHTRYKTYF